MCGHWVLLMSDPVRSMLGRIARVQAGCKNVYLRMCVPQATLVGSEFACVMLTMAHYLGK